jgi:acetyl-CoA carboxylase carboxyl transferase subunit beta
LRAVPRQAGRLFGDNSEQTTGSKKASTNLELRTENFSMSWFKRDKKSIDQVTPPEERRVRTEGLWMKCESCRAIVFRKDLEENLFVCPKCQFHFRVNAKKRLELLFDGKWTEHDAGMVSTDPLKFVDTKPYAKRIKEAQKKLGMNDAVITAEGQLNGKPVICCAMEFGFIGGSMGAVVGEKVTRAIEMAMETRQPLIVVSCSGGARMMEGTISLMQLAKVSAALARLDEEKLPYISVLTDPTTGGVTASFAMLGDLNIAEPGALIGFAGPRVIEQTIRQKLPEGFQRSEFLLEHGFLDAVVHRKDMKGFISSAIDLLTS